MNSTNPEISVIIPVLNCERYLEACLQSVRNQSFKNFEVLIINNGSTDRSPEIAEKFTREDPRFELINYDNPNAGQARNVGIARAKGKFIAFIDGDDSVAELYLEQLYNAITESDADISICGFLLFYLKSNKVVHKHRVPDKKIFDRISGLRELMRDRQMRFYLWNKMFKKSLFLDNNIIIPNMYYEDAVTCSQLFCHADRVVTTDYCGYIYLRASSKRYVELDMNGRRINDYINTVPMIRLYLEQKNIYKQAKTPFLRHILHVFFSVPLLSFQARKKLQNSVFRNSIEGMKKVRKACKAPISELEGMPFKDAVK